MITDRKIDVSRLRKELEHITAHRDEWRQSTWLERSPTSACGTVGCLAGNTALHAGYEFVWDNRNWAAFVETTDGARPIPEVAQELLGLTDEQASDLFWTGNKLHDLWTLAEIYTGGEITTPDDVRAEYRRDESSRPERWDLLEL